MAQNKIKQFIHAFDFGTLTTKLTAQQTAQQKEYNDWLAEMGESIKITHTNQSQSIGDTNGYTVITLTIFYELLIRAD